MTTPRLRRPASMTPFLERHRRIGVALTLVLLLAVGALSGAAVGRLLAVLLDELVAQVGGGP